MTSFASCGMAYRLQRVDGVTELPAWWNVGGTAFHECVREWESFPPAERPDPDDQAERFRHHLAEQTAATVLASGVNLSSWRVARGGKEDREWWLDNAPGWVAAYVTAATARESVIETVGGLPGMEVEFMWSPRAVIAGEKLPDVKGFIDQVHRFPNGDVLIRDLKSGSTKPVDPLQLMVYRLALEDEFGVEVPAGAKWWGDWWMARPGSATRAVDLTDRAAVYYQVTNRLALMDGAERSGYYLANPSSMCSACGVRAACPVMGDPATARPWSLSVLTRQ
jgi:putative RecB family exonuclease